MDDTTGRSGCRLFAGDFDHSLRSAEYTGIGTIVSYTGYPSDRAETSTLE